MHNYFRRLWNWLREGKYLYFFFLLFSLPLFMSHLDEIPIGYGIQDNIRIYGLALQITGTVFVIKSLSGKLNLFEGYGLRGFICDYLIRFPLKAKRDSIILNDDPAVIRVESKGGRISISPQEDLKEVIKYFQEEINYLHSQLKETHRDLNKSINSVSTRVSEIDRKFEQKINETNKKIKSSSVSNVWEEIFGIACLILGVILATVPDYVSSILP